MKKFSFPNKSILFLSLLLTALSCIKKERYDKAVVEPWEPSFAVPLINGTLSLKDIVENVDKKEINVIERENGLYVFVYRDTVLSQTAESLIKIPNQGFLDIFTLPASEILNVNSGRTVVIPFSETALFTMENGENIQYADLKGGNLTLNFTSLFRKRVDVELTFHSLLKNGAPLKRTYNLNYTSGLPVVVNDLIDLSNYRVDLSGNGTTTNTFTYSANITIHGSSEPVTGAESIQLDLGFKDLKYKLMFGDLGNFTFPPYAGEVDIEIFQNAQEGEVVFNDPSLTITLLNTFGVPSSFMLNQFETKTDYGRITPITTTNQPRDLKVPGPNVITAPQAPTDRAAVTTFKLNASNSNIVDAFRGAPSKVNYKMTPSIGSTHLATNNFLHDTSRIRAYVEAQIPMDGSIKVFTMRDTVKRIDLPEREYINYVTFKIRTTSSLPIDVTLQGYWLDSTGKKLDSLLVPLNDIILSGQVNNSGEVVSASTQYMEITYDAARYAGIKNATMLMLEGDLASANNGTSPVKFFASNSLKVELSVFFKGKIEF